MVSPDSYALLSLSTLNTVKSGRLAFMVILRVAELLPSLISATMLVASAVAESVMVVADAYTGAVNVYVSVVVAPAARLIVLSWVEVAGLVVKRTTVLFADIYPWFFTTAVTVTVSLPLYVL